MMLSEEEYLTKLTRIERNIRDLEDQQKKINNKLKILRSEKEDVQNQYHILKIKNRGNIDDWIEKKFPWSDKLQKLLQEKFKFESFRNKQLAAMNATLSKKDVLLVMPTGGGKSLVYQLPCLVDGGLTLVVSPLISLIEDQLMALRKFDIKAATVNGGSSKEEKKTVHSDMVNGKINLLYVTPEWVAKSKIFMTYLQKTYEKGLLKRIVIDEVHCCSTWGHDFRPEYGHLSFFKTMFGGAPLLGLTATATMQVLVDVQSMLGVSEALIMTAPFNRPNLFYRVINKPADKDGCLDKLESLLRSKYKDQSGIIYTGTVRESEEVARGLKGRGLRVHHYHAQLEAEEKRKVHHRWVDGRYQAVVATIAFGMGIDKPDVRFVIHHSVPKSMEGFYQESGRAGRDGQKADCVLMFSLADHLRNVAISSSKHEERNAASMLGYCLDQARCRRALISEHFEDTWNQNDCRKMCDHCSESRRVLKYDITSALDDILSIVEGASMKDTKVTLNKLIGAWFQTGSKELRVETVKKPKCAKDEAEHIVGYLVSKGSLNVDKGYTMYTTVAYLAKGSAKKDGRAIMEYARDLKGFPVVIEDEVVEIDDFDEDVAGNKKRIKLS